jgi:hypothetical protein
MRFILLALILIAPLSLFASPGIPYQVHGTISGASENTVVKAFVNSVEIGNTTVNASEQFGVSPNLFLLEDPESSYAGSEVTFTIDGTNAAQTTTFSNGGLTELILSVQTSTSSGGGGGGRSSTNSPADLNGDGKTDLLDFNIFMTQWGTPAADLNGDGVSDIADFNYFMINWS